MYYGSSARYEIAQTLGLRHVPIISSGRLHEGMQELLLKADCKSLLNSQQLREGLVIKLLGGSDSSKVISNKYLLQQRV